MIKIWKKISFWNKVKGSLIAIAALIQAEMIREDVHWGWNAIAFAISLVVILITHWISDDNNNGIIDIAE